MALWILTKAQPFEHFPATAKHYRICHSMICHEIFTLLKFLSLSWKGSSNTPPFSYLDLLFTSFRSVPNHLPILSLCWSTSCLKLHNSGNWAEISCRVTWQRHNFLHTHSAGQESRPGQTKNSLQWAPDHPKDKVKQCEQENDVTDYQQCPQYSKTQDMHETLTVH
jgi:hypothetical protein